MFMPVACSQASSSSKNNKTCFYREERSLFFGFEEIVRYREQKECESSLYFESVVRRVEVTFAFLNTCNPVIFDLTK